MIHIAPCRTRPLFAVDNRAVAVFETLPAGCTAFTVADRDCAPLLRPGDVAVVDPGDRALDDGELYLYRFGRGTARPSQRIQQISLGTALRSDPDRERWFVGPYARPRSRDEVLASAAAGRLVVCDGPFAGAGLDYLRDGIVGRVVGILAGLEATLLPVQPRLVAPEATEPTTQPVMPFGLLLASAAAP
ncbi:hypothetical protein [Sphingomonas sp. CFBP 8760]|uniref:hypothetical protein n=1 Tax=Sphingomonas sp. CFBP 8760 TaxID=2775282 RepID=UPI001780B5AE|nr:hypothetical protein [Sphingomonas sp. CFBP 8760]MBD8548673.1 hypothetical protein [Sphingomonas sp. CFBP 8760]